MLIIFKMTGILVLVVLATVALLFSFRYPYSKRQLLGRLLAKPFHDYGNGTYCGRPQADYKVYSHYITKYTSIACKWVGQTLHIYIGHPSDSSNNKTYKTTSDGFVQTRRFIAHIHTIVNRLRRCVNQSGKEPSLRTSHFSVIASPTLSAMSAGLAIMT
jgi:hypothetical protein